MKKVYFLTYLTLIGLVRFAYCQTDFSVNSSYPCQGLVQFYDNSSPNTLQWLWIFGDGAVSTQQNPLHQYQVPGNYSVTLLTWNGSFTDTITKADIIQYTPGNSVKSTNCGLYSTTGFQGYGLREVRFLTVSQLSYDASEGYQNFTCPTTPTVYSGDTMSIRIRTDSVFQQDIHLWLDCNGDGDFDSSEQLAEYLSVFSVNSLIRIPVGCKLNENLRLRIIADYTGSNIDPCETPVLGQTEDYSLRILSCIDKPIPGFYRQQKNACEGNIKFIYTGTAGTDSVIWDFGDGNTSTSFEPTHQYLESGTYTIAVHAWNACGDSVLTVPDAIQVNLEAPCDTSQMPPDNTYLSSSSCTGLLYDSRHNIQPPYLPVYSYFIISPPSSQSIELTFEKFNFNFPDTLKIHAGPGISYPVFATYSVLNPPQTNVTIPSGAITIAEVRGFSPPSDGYELIWKCHLLSSENDISFNRTTIHPSIFENHIFVSHHRTVNNVLYKVFSTSGHVLKEFFIKDSHDATEIDFMNIPYRGICFLSIWMEQKPVHFKLVRL